MCLSFVAWKAHPAFLAVILFNRDEFLDRPSLPPHHWENGFFAPKDAVGGGTWIGLSSSGNIAVLTNFREPAGALKFPVSRGAVVTNFLSDTDESPESYMARLHKQDDQIGGYNLLCGNVFTESLWSHSNRAAQENRELSAGIHAVSNGPMTNEWAKMRQGLDALPSVLQSVDVSDTSSSGGKLFDIMGNSALLCTEESAPDTGMAAEIEVELSRMFIPEIDFKLAPDGLSKARLHPHRSVGVQGGKYGTRSQSLVLVTYDGSVSWVERTLQPDGSWDTQQSSFQLQKSSAQTQDTTAGHEEL